MVRSELATLQMVEFGQYSTGCNRRTEQASVWAGCIHYSIHSRKGSVRRPCSIGEVSIFLPKTIFKMLFVRCISTKGFCILHFEIIRSSGTFQIFHENDSKDIMFPTLTRLIMHHASEQHYYDYVYNLLMKFQDFRAACHRCSLIQWKSILS